MVPFPAVPELAASPHSRFTTVALHQKLCVDPASTAPHHRWWSAAYLCAATSSNGMQ